MENKFIKNEETRLEAIRLLRENGKCLIVRPTGFGKSYILAHIASMYERILYFYPRDVISLTIQEKYSEILEKIDITFISYQKMTSIYKKNDIKNREELQRITNSEKTLFIFDEAHLMGANMISNALESLLNLYPKAHILGATATPTRMDHFSIKCHFFGGIVLSSYGISDAINDGIFKKPYYVYSIFEIESNFRRLSENIQMSNLAQQRKKKLLDRIKSFQIKYLELYNEKEVIKSNIIKAGQDTSYMKFICFFPDKDTLYDKIERIIKNFQEIFPDHDINELIVLSDSIAHRRNISKLQKLEKRVNSIDLIFCIDMISYGYHVPDLNGIIMYRNTYSDIVYIQQIGRCISIDSESRPIIFDFVGNYLKHKDVSCNYIFNRDKKNTSEEILKKENVEIIDNLQEFLELERLVEIELNEELENAIIDAYLNKNAPIGYCLKELKINSEDFLKLVERKK